MATNAVQAKAALDAGGWNKAIDTMMSKTAAFQRAASVSFKKVVQGTKDLAKDSYSAAKALGSGLKTGAMYAAGGATAAAGALALVVREAGKSGDELAKMSDRTGLAIDFLSRLKYAAGLSGTSLEELESGIKKMQKSIYSATAGQDEAKAEVGKDLASEKKKEAERLLEVQGELSQTMSKAEAKAADDMVDAKRRGGKNVAEKYHEINERLREAQKENADRLMDARKDSAKRMAEYEKSAAEKLDDGNAAAKAWKDIGIDIKARGGEKPEKLFMDVAQALSQMADANKKAALAQIFFGKRGTALLPLLKEGKKGIQGLFKEADKLSFVWGEKTARAAEGLMDSFERLWAITGGLRERFGVGLFEAIGRVTAGIQGWYERNKQLIDQKVEVWAQGVATWIDAVWQKISTWASDGTFASWWTNISQLVGEVGGIVWNFGSDVIEVFGGIDNAFAIFINTMEGIKLAFNTVWQVGKGIFYGLGTLVLRVVKVIVGAIDGMISGVRSMVGKLTQATSEVLFQWGKIDEKKRNEMYNSGAEMQKKADQGGPFAGYEKELGAAVQFGTDKQNEAWSGMKGGFQSYYSNVMTNHRTAQDRAAQRRQNFGALKGASPAPVNLTINNNGVGNMTPRDAQKVLAATTKEVQRGRAPGGVAQKFGIFNR